MFLLNRIPVKKLATLSLLLCFALIACSSDTAEYRASCGVRTAPVKIQRDEWGVPHVTAKSFNDAAWGQGYAQAQDRLLQMDLLRRTAHGQRAELLGADELEMDKLVRTLGLTRAASSSMTALTDKSLCLVEAYTAGVNQFIEDMQTGANGASKPSDLQQLDSEYIPQKWQPLDVVGVATAAIFSLSSNLQTDLVLTAAELLEDKATLAKVIHHTTLTNAATVQPGQNQPLIVPVTEQTGLHTAKFNRLSADPTITFEAQRSAQNHQFVVLVQKLTTLLSRFKEIMGPAASNNWAVQSSKSKNGFTYMASDPHGAITIPSSFHEIHLMIEEPNINAYGIAVAGTPMIHIGHNQYTAWSFTNYSSDVGDLYEETIIEDSYVVYNGQQVLLDSHSESILVRPAAGKVAEATPVEFEVRVVPHHGPILNDVLPNPLPLLFSNKVVSYKWLGAGPTKEAQALANLVRVLDWESYMTTVQDWEVGSQNTIYADINGNIGYWASGVFPERPWISDNLQPIVPLPGDGSAEWGNLRGAGAIQSVYNPEVGFLASANGDPDGRTKGNLFNSQYLGYGYDVGFRSARLQDELLRQTQQKSVDLAAMEKLQTDVFSGLAFWLTPRLLVALDSATETSALFTAAEVLRHWDYQSESTSAAASIFHQVFAHLIADNVAPMVTSALRPLLLDGCFFSCKALKFLIESNDKEAFPDGIERAIQQAFVATTDELQTFFGTTNPTVWHWGDLHVRLLEHPMGGAFNRGPLASGGGMSVVNRSDFSFLAEKGLKDLPYKITDGADMRFVVEMKPGEIQTRIMLPAGSSGDPASKHYDDQFTLWLQGKYRNAHYWPEDVTKATVTTIEFK